MLNLENHRIRGISYLVVLFINSAVWTNGAPKPRPGDEQAELKDLPFIYQKQDQWCWAATAQMALATQGIRLSQCEVASRTLGKNCCINPISCNGPFYVDAAIKANGGRFAYKTVDLNPTKVMNEIDRGRPVIAGTNSIRYNHFVVVYGYFRSPELYFKIFDPIYGHSRVKVRDFSSSSAIQRWTWAYYLTD